jgi:hypothetical protein
MMGFLEEDDDGQGKIDADIQSYADKALELNPNQASAYTLLFDLYGGRGDIQKRDLYKQKAFDAIDKDISLGQQERKALRSYLESEITVVEEPAAIVAE